VIGLGWDSRTPGWGLIHLHYTKLAVSNQQIGQKQTLAQSADAVGWAKAPLTPAAWAKSCARRVHEQRSRQTILLALHGYKQRTNPISRARERAG
jgi:hypothetical protein